jgi:hypothetical protein
MLSRVIFIAAFLGFATAAGAQQDEPVPTFGTTVVDSAGLRGTIYYLHSYNASSKMSADSLLHMKPRGTIYTRSLNVPPRDFREGFPGVTKRFEWFAIDYMGKFWIERPGDYEFSLLSDDGSMLYIDDRMIIDNGKMHPAETKEGRVELGRGAHNIRVSYFQGPKWRVALVLKVAGPGEKLRVFTLDEFRPRGE